MTSLEYFNNGWDDLKLGSFTRSVTGDKLVEFSNIGLDVGTELWSKFSWTLSGLGRTVCATSWGLELSFINWTLTNSRDWFLKKRGSVALSNPNSETGSSCLAFPLLHFEPWYIVELSDFEKCKEKFASLWWDNKQEKRVTLIVIPT